MTLAPYKDLEGLFLETPKILLKCTQQAISVFRKEAYIVH